MEEHGKQYPETVLNRDEILSLIMLINILLIEPESYKHAILPVHSEPFLLHRYPLLPDLERRAEISAMS